MPSIEMICLANSVKHGGRCIAGLRTDGQGWIRPVAPGTYGTLFPWHYVLDGGGEPQVMDVVAVDCTAPYPSPHQPENWRVGRPGWRRLRRETFTAAGPLLRASLAVGPCLLGDCQDKVNFGRLRLAPARASLALIRPSDLCWKIIARPEGGRRSRAMFHLDGGCYDLPVTDPAWTWRLRHLSPGIHPLRATGLTANDTILLTISLGEPTAWDNCCYKLVAAVIVLPVGQRL